jgi:hypothetical protein
MNIAETKYFQRISQMDQDQFQNWFLTLSDEEADYALELMAKARAEIQEKIVQLFEEPEATENLDVAKSILGKYTLGGTV